MGHFVFIKVYRELHSFPYFMDKCCFFYFEWTDQSLKELSLIMDWSKFEKTILEYDHILISRRRLSCKEQVLNILFDGGAL